MKAFVNANARDPRHAATLVQQARQEGRSAVLAGGGSDLLGMMKDRLVAPDVLVNLKTIKGLDQIRVENGALTIGALTTLDTVSANLTIRRDYTVLAEAASQVATPQIRNVGTIGGNITQRPWCWYYRNGFHCFKNGGSTCYSASGENQFHAIFGGGPSYIVHPSDTAPALVALDATFHIVGPSGERNIAAAEFFTPPAQDVTRENVLRDGDVLASISLPRPRANQRSTYHKIMDREAWTHAIVSAAIIVEMSGDTCRSARIVLGGVAPIPWRLPEVERLLAGKRLTPELAAQAGTAAITGARPLAKNGYKVQLTRAMVKRTLEQLANGPA
jgi:xanthine dehydrogenase YagS FAD-binding subunit